MKSNPSIGVRVRMSVLGASRCARLAKKSGTIVGGRVYVKSVSVCSMETDHRPRFIVNTLK